MIHEVADEKFLGPICDTPYFVQTYEDVEKCSTNKGIFVAFILFVLTCVVLFSQKNRLNMKVILASLIFNLILSIIIVMVYKKLNINRWRATQITAKFLSRSDYEKSDKLLVLKDIKPSDLDKLFPFFFGIYFIGWLLLIFGIKIDLKELIKSQLEKK